MVEELEDAPRASSTFAALRYRNYRRLYISGCIVFLATNAQTIARGWLAKDLTGTNAGLGGVLLGFGVAMLIVTPLGGVAADRLPKKYIIISAQLLIAVTSLWIGLAVQFDFVAYWMLIVAGAMQATAFACYGPSRVAFTTELIEGEDIGNAIVLVQISAESMRIIGPTIAGVLIGGYTWGTAGIFLGCGVFCAVACLFTLFLPPGRPSPNRVSRSPLAEMRDGLRYVRRRRDISLLVACSLGVIIVGYPYMAFLPTVADGIFDRGASGYGILSGASAVGAVVSGFFVASRGGHHDPWRLAVIGGGGVGACLLLLSLAPTFPVAVVVVGLTGGVMLVFQSTVNSLLLTLSDFDYHGRIQSLVMLGFSGFGIAALPIGAFADAVGLRPTLAIMGALILVIMSSFAARRRRHRVIELVFDLG